MNYLKQSTAFTDKLGPFLDSADGDTEETALTISTTDVRVSKNGTAGAAQDAGAAAPSHDERSWYSINYTTTDTSTLGFLRVYIHVAGALAVWKDYTVLPSASFDALITNGLNNLGGVAQTADNDILLQEIPTNTEFNARTLLSSGYATSSNLAVVDTVVDAIKVKTDQLTFTVTNQVDVNMLTHTSPIPTNYITAAGITNNSLDGKGDWNIGKTGYSLTTTPPTSVQIWAESTRTLTSGLNIVLTKGVGVTGFNDISATEIVTNGAITTLTGSVVTVSNLTGHTPQTGDNFARIGLNGAGLTDINLPNQTMDISGNLSGSVGSVTSGVTVSTNNDKNGYSLVQGFPSNFSSMSISVSGDTSADINKINGVTITGDGSGTPFDV